MSKMPSALLAGALVLFLSCPAKGQEFVTVKKTEYEDLKARLAQLESQIRGKAEVANKDYVTRDEFRRLETQVSELVSLQRETLGALRNQQQPSSTRFVPVNYTQANTDVPRYYPTNSLPPVGTVAVSFRGPGGGDMRIGGGTVQFVDGSHLEITASGIAGADVPVGSGRLMAGRVQDKQAPTASPSPILAGQQRDDTVLTGYRYPREYSYLTGPTTRGAVR